MAKREVVQQKKYARIKSGTCPDYLTKGKWYEVVEDYGNGGDIINDKGDKITIDYLQSTHLDGGSWEIKEKKGAAMKEKAYPRKCVCSMGVRQMMMRRWNILPIPRTTALTETIRSPSTSWITL
jgi:hypothetical protein